MLETGLDVEPPARHLGRVERPFRGGAETRLPRVGKRWPGGQSRRRQSLVPSFLSSSLLGSSVSSHSEQRGVCQRREHMLGTPTSPAAASVRRRVSTSCAWSHLTPDTSGAGAPSSACIADRK